MTLFEIVQYIRASPVNRHSFYRSEYVRTCLYFIGLVQIVQAILKNSPAYTDVANFRRYLPDCFVAPREVNMGWLRRKFAPFFHLCIWFRSPAFFFMFHSPIPTYLSSVFGRVEAANLRHLYSKQSDFKSLEAFFGTSMSEEKMSQWSLLSRSLSQKEMVASCQHCLRKLRIFFLGTFQACWKQFSLRPFWVPAVSV